MGYLLAALWCIPIIELAMRMPFILTTTKLARMTGRASYLMQAKYISDHWKEKALLAYAQTTLLATIQLAAMLTLVAAMAISLLWLLNQAMPGFSLLATSWIGISTSLASACLYVKLRKLP